MRFCVLILMCLASGELLSGDSLSYTVTPGGGLFSYNFTLHNTGASGGTLFDLFLSVATDISTIDASTIGTPIGWGDPAGGLVFDGPDVNPGTSFIEWSADGSGLYDLAISDFLSGFTFTSSQEPSAPVQFALNGSSTFDTAQQISSSTPENTKLPMIVVVVGLMALAKLRQGPSPGCPWL